MLKANLGVQGFYKLTVSKDKECKEVVKESGWMPNLITNAGMNRIGDSKFVYGHVDREWHVGSGNTTPDYTDTALETPIASTSYDGYPNARGTTGTYAYYRYVRQFDQGAAEGNIAEVGIGPDGGDLFSRALVVDDQGNPTTITVLDNEFLTLSYELRINIPQSDFLSTVNFVVDGSNVSTDITMRAAGVDSDKYWGERSYYYLGVCSQFRAGNHTMGPISDRDLTGDVGDVTTNTYVENSHEITGSAHFGLNEANYTGGVNYIFIRGAAGFGSWKANFDPPLDKDNTKELTFDFGVSWTRA